jgi:hypothetical protein
VRLGQVPFGDLGADPRELVRVRGEQGQRAVRDRAGRVVGEEPLRELVDGIGPVVRRDSGHRFGGDPPHVPGIQDERRGAAGDAQPDRSGAVTVPDVL